jgi:type II secretory pathway pseudopilin PulG
VLRYLKSLKDGGDTIVEVLFAVVVIGIVLTGAYAVVTHSLLDEQDAQEHSYALGLAQSQVEELRAYILSNSPATLPFNNQSGCMYSPYSPTISSLSVELNAGGTPSTDCVVSGSSSSGPSYILSIALKPGSNPNSNPVYQVSAQWPSLISGVTTDRIMIPYEVN